MYNEKREEKRVSNPVFQFSEQAETNDQKRNGSVQL